ncbi:armadillo-type protein [Flammula alnicola]|nr:armadillo-type protein [Flammula alnicola]
MAEIDPPSRKQLCMRIDVGLAMLINGVAWMFTWATRRKRIYREREQSGQSEEEKQNQNDEEDYVLPALIQLYKRRGYFEEIINLLEAGLILEHAHMGIFTKLSILLSKYKPAKFMEHLKLFFARINIPKVIKATEKAHLWPELVFLYIKYNEFDNAALATIERSVDAWEHNQFEDVIVRAANVEIYYKALSFYLRVEQPTLSTDLLTVPIPRIDQADRSHPSYLLRARIANTCWE